MIDWINNLLSRVLCAFVHWGVTAPVEQLYAGMALCGVLLIALLWSMRPRRTIKFTPVEPVVIHPIRQIEVVDTSAPAAEIYLSAASV